MLCALKATFNLRFNCLLIITDMIHRIIMQIWQAIPAFPAIINWWLTSLRLNTTRAMLVITSSTTTNKPKLLLFSLRVGGSISGCCWRRWWGVTKDCMIRTHINYWLQDFSLPRQRYKPNAINIKGQQALWGEGELPKTPSTQNPTTMESG